jgi:hypothetical protein
MLVSTAQSFKNQSKLAQKPSRIRVGRGAKTRKTGHEIPFHYHDARIQINARGIKAEIQRHKGYGKHQHTKAASPQLVYILSVPVTLSHFDE